MSTYCTRAEIELRFGADNVADWADLDNDGNATTITNTINDAISEASDQFDGLFRATAYRIPLTSESTGATPTEVAFMCSRLAGVLLHEKRGVQDWDPKSGTPAHSLSWHRDDVLRWLAAVRQGHRLDAVMGG
jgi:phage gp36-like protein